MRCNFGTYEASGLRFRFGGLNSACFVGYTFLFILWKREKSLRAGTGRVAENVLCLGCGKTSVCSTLDNTICDQYIKTYTDYFLLIWSPSRVSQCMLHSFPARQTVVSLLQHVLLTARSNGGVPANMCWWRIAFVGVSRNTCCRRLTPKYCQ